MTRHFKLRVEVSQSGFYVMAPMVLWNGAFYYRPEKSACLRVEGYADGGERMALKELNYLAVAPA